MGTKHATAQVVTPTPALRFRPNTPPDDMAAASALFDAYQRGQGSQVVVRGYSLTGARIVGQAETGPVVRFALFTSGIKRDGSEVVVDGLDLTNLRRNPRVMWAHEYARPPIGNWINFEFADHAQFGRVLYADAAPLRTIESSDPHIGFARMIFAMLAAHDLDASSGGWHPLEMEALTTPDGFHRGFKFIRSDVLEGSIVPVPADPDALQIQRAIQRGIVPAEFVDRFVLRGDKAVIYTVRDVASASAGAAELRDEARAMRAAIEGAQSLTDPQDDTRDAVAFKKTPANADKAWDGAAATARVAKWASSDGSGDKATIDWAKYRQAFAWFDSSAADTFGAYSLPHHDIVGGTLTVLWKGVAAAAQRIDQTSIPAGDLDAVKAHLASEYALFGEKAPWKREADDTDRAAADQAAMDDCMKQMAAKGLNPSMAKKACEMKLKGKHAADSVEQRQAGVADAAAARDEMDAALGEITSVLTEAGASPCDATQQQAVRDACDSMLEATAVMYDAMDTMAGDTQQQAKKGRGDDLRVALVGGSAAMPAATDTEAVRAAVAEALQDIPLLRTGAVLSAKNKQAITDAMAKMKDAMANLDAVMADAMKGGDATQSAAPDPVPADDGDEVAATLRRDMDDMKAVIARFTEREEAQSVYRGLLGLADRVERRASASSATNG